MWVDSLRIGSIFVFLFHTVVAVAYAGVRQRKRDVRLWILRSRKAAYARRKDMDLTLA